MDKLSQVWWCFPVVWSRVLFGCVLFGCVLFHSVMFRSIMYRPVMFSCIVFHVVYAQLCDVWLYRGQLWHMQIGWTQRRSN